MTIWRSHEAVPDVVLLEGSPLMVWLPFGAGLPKALEMSLSWLDLARGHDCPRMHTAPWARMLQ
eukprot:7090784-Alexandrium_andersonii.AAC.1